MREAGFSYTELLVATLLIVTALVPAIDALGPGLKSSREHRAQAEMQYVLYGKLETVLAEPFSALDAAAVAAGGYQNATSYSDMGASVPHKVYIWRYDVDDADGDGDEFTDGEADLLWISVATADGSQALQTLLSAY